MHDDEFEDVDDQSDEDNGSGKIFSQGPLVQFYYSECPLVGISIGVLPT